MTDQISMLQRQWNRMTREDIVGILLDDLDESHDAIARGMRTLVDHLPNRKIEFRVWDRLDRMMAVERDALPRITLGITNVYANGDRRFHVRFSWSYLPEHMDGAGIPSGSLLGDLLAAVTEEVVTEHYRSARLFSGDLYTPDAPNMLMEAAIKKHALGDTVADRLQQMNTLQDITEYHIDDAARYILDALIKDRGGQSND